MRAMRSPCHRRGWRSALLALASLLAGCTSAPRAEAVPQALSVADVESWRSEHSWHSREELLQFFADEDAAFRRRQEVNVSAETLAQMARELSTLFPLGACTGIAYRQGTLTISFSSQQLVPVPGAYHQAFLAIPTSLVLRVVPPTRSDPRWGFVVVGPPLGFQFSLLARMLGPDFVRNFAIDALEYRLDETAHRSSLGVENTYQRTRGAAVIVNGRVPADMPAAEHYLEVAAADLGDTDARLVHETYLRYHEAFAFDLERRRFAVLSETFSHEPPAHAPGGP